MIDLRLPPASITYVCGQRGTGKTTLIRALLTPLPRVLVFDHTAEYADLPGVHVFNEAQDAIRYLRLHPTGIARCVLVPLEGSAELFAFLCRVPLAIRDLTFAVDELDLYAGSVNPPAPVELRRLVHFGRHFGCSLIASSRRPADVSRAVTSQARTIFSFRQWELTDVRYLGSLVGKSAKRLPELPDLCYMRFHDRTVTQGRLEL